MESLALFQSVGGEILGSLGGHGTCDPFLQPGNEKIHRYLRVSTDLRQLQRFTAAVAPSDGKTVNLLDTDDKDDGEVGSVTKVDRRRE